MERDNLITDGAPAEPFRLRQIPVQTLGAPGLCVAGPLVDRSRQGGGFATFRLRSIGALLLVLILGATGCTQIRLPAIDRTGTCLFSRTESTTLSPPSCFGGDGCLSGLCGLSCKSCLGRPGGCTSCLGNLFPKPAFPEPVDPPPCLQGNGPGMPGCVPPGAAVGGPCVPGGAPYSEDCAKGPPAVVEQGADCCLHGGCLGRCCSLPKRGERGRLLLSPGRVVAPVGGEVVLLSGVCGNDGYLVTGEPIEWMLTPESVGHFIEIAPDDSSLLQRLSNHAEVQKVSGSYARGLTRTKPAVITRGTLTPNDDVRLDAGQAWATVSSPTEGVSRITALAPESDCWDQRKATTTIYWVDARWTFPRPVVERAGVPVTLTTNVTRSEGSIKATGWIVRYTILNPELGGFGPNGLPTAEVLVDRDGNASVVVTPLAGASGTATVAIEVIRPEGTDANIPALPIAQGQTIVTWTSPRLAMSAQAPAAAAFDEPFTVTAVVSNPGNLATGPVALSVQIPAGVQFLGSEYEHQQWPEEVLWTFDEGIPAGQQAAIPMRLSAREPLVLMMQARDQSNGLVASDEARIDVMVPSIQLRVTPDPATERITVGEEAAFNITVLNSGQRPLQGVELKVEGDSGLIEVSQGSHVVFNGLDDPLPPNEVWEIPVRFRATSAGTRCVTVTTSAVAQAPVTADACITAINPAPQVPAVEAAISAEPEVRVGTFPLYRYIVRNTGREALSNVLVTVTFPGQFEFSQATTANRDLSALGQYQVKWMLPRLEAGQQSELLVEYKVVGPIGLAETYLTVGSAEGAQATDTFQTQVFPALAPPPLQPEPPPAITPSGPTPRVPASPFNPYGDAGPLEPLPGSNLPGGGGAALPPGTNAPGSNAPGTNNSGINVPGTNAPGTNAPGTNAPGTNGTGNGGGSPLAPPPLAGDGGAAGALRVSVFDNRDPATVGERVIYTIRVTNAANVDDAQVQVRFRITPDVPIVSISQTQYAEAVYEREQAGYHYLREVPNLAAGATIEYQLTVQADSPQPISIEVEGYSRNFMEGSRASDQTRVLPP